MQDDAALRADEIAAGLPQVCFLDHGRDTFEPTRWDPGGSVVFPEQPPRLCRVGSQYAVRLSLGGLVEEPDACRRRKTILALEENRNAHGRTQLAVGHHSDETAASIRALKLPPGVADKVFFDEDLPGFGLRVRASGVHSWMVQYAIAGRTRRMVLGLLTALDPGKARTTAKDLLAEARLGHDPAAEKDRARAAAAETFGALLPRFLERQRTRLKPRSYVETERHLTKHAKPLHGSPIEAVTRRAIAGRL